MENRLLTPRQLLIVVLVACRDAGHDVLSKQRILNVLFELRDGAPSFVPGGLDWRKSGNRYCSPVLEKAFSGLHLTGAAFDAVENTITVSGTLSEAEIYKPLHDREREELALALLPYVSAFVGRMVRPDPNAPKAKPDPRFS